MPEPQPPGTLLRRRLTPDAAAWLDDAVARTAAGTLSLRSAFPAVGRRCGRGPLTEGWTVEDAARAVLLTALPLSGPALAAEVRALYDLGDAAERRAVLRALPLLDAADPAFAGHGLPLVQDALRSNDNRLIEAALGPYATRHLDADSYRQAVLKCVFCEIPLSLVDGLAQRHDPQLPRMFADFARERIAAGRAVPADVLGLLRSRTVTAGSRGDV